jgi:hypothetical protein
MKREEVLKDEKAYVCQTKRRFPHQWVRQLLKGKILRLQEKVSIEGEKGGGDVFGIRD